jgi:hypothetical protein
MIINTPYIQTFDYYDCLKSLYCMSVEVVCASYELYYIVQGQVNPSDIINLRCVSVAAFRKRGVWSSLNKNSLPSAFLIQYCLFSNKDHCHYPEHILQ